MNVEENTVLLCRKSCAANEALGPLRWIIMFLRAHCIGFGKISMKGGKEAIVDEMDDACKNNQKEGISWLITRN